MEGRFGPAAATTVLQGTFHALTRHVRGYQSLSMQRARHIHNAGFVPTAGKTQAILRAYMGPGLNRGNALPTVGLELRKGLFYRTC